MIVKVQYFNDKLNAYAGNTYTYRTELPVEPHMEVLAPVSDEGNKRALVREINLQESTIQPEWADRVKTITKLYERKDGE